jgi:site-specific recombinase XerD
MATDFALALRRFLTSYLAGLRGCSPSTIASYRDTFKLLISWFRDERSVPPGRLALDHLDADAVTAFLGWLQDSRHNSVSTRNQRLAAISSFCTWMQTEDPARMACWQDIVAIPVKKQDRPAVRHLTAGQTRRLLAQPDRSTRQGRRDATLLATLYDTGARVSELANLAVRDIRLQNPAMASLTGKGRKTRHVPLDGSTVTLLAAYLKEHRLDQPGHDDHPVFYGQHRARLSRGGIAWIIRKYQAQTRDPLLAGASIISPHILRHSKAMHLYEAGVPLPYIRDILGHVDLSTTEIYARASTEAKRKALEAAYQGIVTSDLPEWNQDAGLLDWLTNL